MMTLTVSNHLPGKGNEHPGHHWQEDRAIDLQAQGTTNTVRAGRSALLTQAQDSGCCVYYGGQQSRQMEAVEKQSLGMRLGW